MAGLKDANEPEQDVDIEEEQDIGKKKGMIVAPWPKGGERMVGILVMTKEREVEEDGR